MEHQQPLEEEELSIMLRASCTQMGGDPTQLAYSTGDVITYFPQRPSVRGMAVGRVHGRVGTFRLADTQVLPVGWSFPPARKLPTMPLQKPVADVDAQPWLPSASLTGGSTRKLVSLVLNNSSSCRLARFLSNWIIFLILISTLSFVLETLPEFHVDGGPELKHPAVWNSLEAFIVMQFSLEYALRLASCNGVCEFVFSPMNLVDIAAIAPWYLELLQLASPQSAILRVFRLARVVRIFKLGKYALGLQLFARTFAASLDVILLLLFFMAMVTVLCSSLIFFCERGEWSEAEGKWINADGEESAFTSIMTSLWWCVVTLTTVGYGDMVPASVAGRCVAMVTMLAGILTLSLPISILGSNFLVEAEASFRSERRQKNEEHVQGVCGNYKLLTPLHQELNQLGELFEDVQDVMKRANDEQLLLQRILKTHEGALSPKKRRAQSTMW